MHNPPMAPGPSPQQPIPPLPTWVTFLARRKLAGPALLFAAGHRPLAFVTGQMLHLLNPLAGLLGLSGWDGEAQGWAELLSQPDGAHQVTALLEAARQRPMDGPQ